MGSTNPDRVPLALGWARILGHGSVVVLFGMLSSAQAQFSYSTNGGTATITGYPGPGAAVIIPIPPEIDGLPVTGIGSHAFNGYSRVSSVTIPNTVTNIGSGAFDSCTSLTNVTFAGSVVTIGSAAFSGCTALSEVTIPGVTILGEASFSNCDHLTNFTVLTGLTSIGDMAFYRCSNLSSVSLPDTLASIGREAFAYCSSLIGITLPTNVTSIGSGAFGDCRSLTSVTIPGGVSYLADYAFDSCSSLVSVTIPDSVTSIGDWTFGYCLNLASITIPENVTSIGDYAFDSCASLTKVTVPAGVMEIGLQAFSRCTALPAITVDSLNPLYTSADGVLFDRNMTTLLQCPAGKSGNYSVPAGVISIGDFGFENCAGLSTIRIPNTLDHIGQYAFYNCFSLIGVYFQGDAPSLVGSGVFTGDNNARMVYLPGASGWDTNLGGLPALLWNPQWQITTDGSGVEIGSVRFTMVGSPNLVVVVEASTDAVNSTWIPISTNTLFNGSSQFEDPDFASFPGRFYRLGWP